VRRGEIKPTVEIPLSFGFSEQAIVLRGEVLKIGPAAGSGRRRRGVGVGMAVAVAMLGSVTAPRVRE
jgi:hypothetical protein